MITGDTYDAYTLDDTLCETGTFVNIDTHCSIEDIAEVIDLYKKARKKWKKVVEYKISRTIQIVN